MIKYNSAFDNDEQDHDWKKEWQDMPEFVQKRQKPYLQLTVRFDCQEDVDEFAKLVGQEISPKTKYIWHPRLDRTEHSNKRYVDDES